MSAITSNRREAARSARRLPVGWLAGALAVLAAALNPPAAAAQLIAVRVASLDVQGGAVFASDSEAGVVFGARLAAADLFGGWLRCGVHFDWWTADRRRSDVEVRDVVSGLSFWRTIGSARAPLRPYLGVATSLHSVDTSLSGGAPFPGEPPPEAERLEGVRIGATGFAGLSLKLTRTGAIRVLAEYRYTALSNLSHQEARIGARLLPGAR